MTCLFRAFFFSFLRACLYGSESLCECKLWSALLLFDSWDGGRKKTYLHGERKNQIKHETLAHFSWLDKHAFTHITNHNKTTANKTKTLIYKLEWNRKAGIQVRKSLL